MTHRLRNALINGAVALIALYLVGYLGLWKWSICRIEVPAGQSLLLRYKGPFPFGGATQAPKGPWSRPGRSTGAAGPALAGRHPGGHARPRPALLFAPGVRLDARPGHDHQPRRDRPGPLQARQAAAPGRVPGRARLPRHPAPDLDAGPLPDQHLRLRRLQPARLGVRRHHQRRPPPRARVHADPHRLRRRRDQQGGQPPDRRDPGTPGRRAPARHLLPEPRREARRHPERRLQPGHAAGRGPEEPRRHGRL
jgi:hypothetical protein